MSSILAHSDPIGLSHPNPHPHSLLNSSATPSPAPSANPPATSTPSSTLASTPPCSSASTRRPARPGLRSTKTDSGVGETILEADELLCQAPSQSPPQSQQRPIHRSSIASHLPLSSTRGLDHDHLLGPRRASTSSSFRDDKPSSHLSQSAPSPSDPKPFRLPAQSSQVFYSSSPTTPWPTSSTHHDPAGIDPVTSSPRPRSNTASSSAASTSAITTPLDPLEPSHQPLTPSASIHGPGQFVSPRSNSTPAFPPMLQPSSSPDIPKRSSQSISAGSTSNQPVTLRPRADSYAHAGWKGWSTGGGLSGPLDYLPNREPAADRKSWLTSSAANVQQSTGTFQPTLCEDPQSVLPRSLSLHDLHSFEPPQHHHQSHVLGRYGSHAQLSTATTTNSSASAHANNSLYAEPVAGPNHSLNLNLVGSIPCYQPSQASDPRSSDYHTSHLAQGAFSNPLQPPCSGPRIGVRGEPVPDEISTIFVVGFPDDMNEREFQNMFMFSAGFEAATLKVPASTLAARERDMTAAVVAAAAAASGAVKTPGGVGFGPGGPHRLGGLGHQQGGVVVDQFGMPVLGLDGFEDGFANQIGLESQFVGARHPLGLGGPLVAGCLGANLQGMMDLQAGMGGSTNRKQIIGFAKFKTRADALHARDVLSGRKVDAEKGNVLKAEMAKKNLHTKRGLSNEIGATLPGSQSVAGGMMMSMGGGQSNNVPVNDIGGYNFGVRTDFVGTGIDMKGAGEKNIMRRASMAAEMLRGGEGSEEAQHENVSGGGELDCWRLAARMGPLQLSPTNNAPFQARGPSEAEPRESTFGYSARTGEISEGATAGVRGEWIGSPSPMIEASLGKSLWEKLESDEEGVVASEGTRSGASEHEASRADGSSGSGGSDGSAGSFRGSSKPGSAGTTVWAGPAPAGRSQYPADQNPAINTLYVGGLPAVVEAGDLCVGGGPMPSLGLMRSDELEAGLRKTFGVVEGFKRLSYKVKNQQPMCFVEFETVEQASRAMEHVYGDKIEGKVCGGIRLAFSRNALGVRSNGSSSCSSSVNSCQLPTSTPTCTASSAINNISHNHHHHNHHHHHQL